MSLGLWNLQWLNHNSQRSYPLTERASKTDTLNTIRLPDSFIVALKLPVNAGLAVEPEKFYLKSLLLAPTGYNITIGYDTGETNTEDNPDVAAVNIAKSAYTPNRAYALGGIDDYSDTVGQVVIGRLDEIDALPAGRYFFSPAAGQLEPDAIVPNIRGITRLRVSNGDELSAPIYGDVTLVAGTNMRLALTTQQNEDPIVTFSAISGLNLNEDCVCDVPNTGTCIRCINGVCSDDGNFQLNQGECISITEVAGGLLFADTCAKPCCGCSELDALTTQIDKFDGGVATLQGFVTRLGSEVTQMSLVVLGSRLGDAGCSTC
jgi:hypothetical protein